MPKTSKGNKKFHVCSTSEAPNATTPLKDNKQQRNTYKSSAKCRRRHFEESNTRFYHFSLQRASISTASSSSLHCQDVIVQASDTLVLSLLSNLTSKCIVATVSTPKSNLVYCSIRMFTANEIAGLGETGDIS